MLVICFAMEKYYYRRLDVYQNAKQLAIDIHELLKCFPQDERFALTDQLRRASTSIMFNIAEGFGRDSHKDFVNFLLISRGSLFEVGTQLDIATRLGYFSNTDEIDHLMESIARMLGSLIRTLRTSAPSTNYTRSHLAPSTKHQAPTSSPHQAPSTKH